MATANDPVNPDSDIRILEESILEAAHQFGLKEFALSLVETKQEVLREAA